MARKECFHAFVRIRDECFCHITIAMFYDISLEGTVDVDKARCLKFGEPEIFDMMNDAIHSSTFYHCANRNRRNDIHDMKGSSNIVKEHVIHADDIFRFPIW